CAFVSRGLWHFLLLGSAALERQSLDVSTEVRSHWRALLNRTLAAWFDSSNSEAISPQEWPSIRRRIISRVTLSKWLKIWSRSISLSSPSPWLSSQGWEYHWLTSSYVVSFRLASATFRKKTRKRYRRTSRIGAIWAASLARITSETVAAASSKRLTATHE